MSEPLISKCINITFWRITSPLENEKIWRMLNAIQPYPCHYFWLSIAAYRACETTVIKSKGKRKENISLRVMFYLSISHKCDIYGNVWVSALLLEHDSKHFYLQTRDVSWRRRELSGKDRLYSQIIKSFWKHPYTNTSLVNII